VSKDKEIADLKRQMYKLEAMIKGIRYTANVTITALRLFGDGGESVSSAFSKSAKEHAAHAEWKKGYCKETGCSVCGKKDFDCYCCEGCGTDCGCCCYCDEGYDDE